jgi:hypothetical protein
LLPGVPQKTVEESKQREDQGQQMLTSGVAGHYTQTVED